MQVQYMGSDANASAETEFVYPRITNQNKK